MEERNEYRVLYRKWRPHNFDDVVGQPQVVDVLRAQLREGRVSHAYIFAGSRGTGKTTCARILAKAVNCLDPLPDGSPCNKCEMCRDIDRGLCSDVVEMNGSSERGIDDIRWLTDIVSLVPSAAKRRVFIIDEFHMMTKEAFNALLVTLEEPPENVLFILCTTDIQMVPDTILSRCQRFSFMRIEPSALAGRLEYIASQEGIELDEDAAMLMASVADGAMRDAISLLDRCSTLGGRITAARAASVAGIFDKKLIYSIIDSIARADVASVLTAFGDLHDKSSDDSMVCAELINEYRNLIFIKTLKEPGRFIACTKDQLASMQKTAEAYTLPGLLRNIRILSETKNLMFRSDVRRAVMETALIRLCEPDTDEDVSALAGRVAELENKLAVLTASPAVRVPDAAAAGVSPVKSAPAAPAVPAQSSPAADAAGEFRLPFDDEEDKPSPAPVNGGSAADEDDDEPVSAADLKLPGLSAAEPAVSQGPDAGGDRELPLKTSLNIIMSAEKYFIPLTGTLHDTKWRVSGSRLIISNCSKALIMAYNRNQTAQSALRRAVHDILAHEYEIVLSE